MNNMKNLLINSVIINKHISVCDYCGEVAQCFIGTKILGKEDGNDIYAKICEHCVSQLYNKRNEVELPEPNQGEIVTKGG